MAVESIFMPDARDRDVLSVKPVRELESCNHLLDDHAALMRFHDDEGYILLRDVLDAGSVEEARKAMFAVMERHGLLEPGATEPACPGTPSPVCMQERPKLSGLSRRIQARKTTSS